MDFPTERRTDRDPIPAPPPGQRALTNPPAFVWIPVEGAAGYRLQVTSVDGKPVVDARTETNVFLPATILAPGRYQWTVDALDEEGHGLARREPYPLTVPPGVPAQPYPDIAALFAGIPRTHPRILFTADRLPEIRASLGEGRAEAWQRLQAQVGVALEMGVPDPPHYEQIEDPVTRRREYVLYFQYIRRYVDFALQVLSLAWLMTEDAQYAEAAKAIFFSVGEWANEGVGSVNWAHGDEPGLSTCRCMHRAYDWLYPAMSGAERQAGAEICLRAARDNWTRIYHHRNFHCAPGASHDGRLIAYLGEQAVALCDVAPPEEAQRWLDFSLKAFMTIYPHWGGKDGGWAEGISYGNAYNLIYLPWIEVLRAVSDVDLWQRPFFSKVRNFFMFCTTPDAEMRPFGDGADPRRNAAIRHQQLYALLRHHGQRFGDPLAVWWAEQLDPDWSTPSFTPVTTTIAADRIAPAPPQDGRVMKVFRGIGWAALHSDFGNFADDVFILFKSSPYGSVSHQHADQNAFHVAVGGKALAIPSGYYAPYYGSPHHAEWTRAQNAILVDGEGQVIRDHRARGEIVDFEHAGALSYVCGDATEAYQGRLDAWRRHLFFVRPGLLVIVDDVAAPQASTFQWLLHALEPMALDEDAQRVEIVREDVRMDVDLVSTLGQALSFSQSDRFEPPVDAGQPPAYDDRKPDQYHFTAETPVPTDRIRFVAVARMGRVDAMPDVSVERDADHLIATLKDEAGEGTVEVPLTPDAETPGTAIWYALDGSRTQVGPTDVTL
jgi:hypothetical protein